MSGDKISRLGLSNKEMASKYGPLSGLIGTWSGNQGVNLIAVPDQKGSFTLLVAPYYETLTVTALSSPTPNRGLKTIENIPTLMYSLMIHDATNNELMHAENGIWELLDGSKDNDGYNLARISTVPHGDAIMALGNATETKGRPNIDSNLSSSPVLDFPTFGYGEAVYNDVYVPGFITRKPNQYLIDHLDKQEKEGKTVISSINLNVSTANNGGINNIPSINKNADATAFNSTFWIETVQNSKTGRTFQQLQYSQNTNINFPVKGTPKGKTIGWPHINVNTLIKQ
ncbi:heme-binding protein [Pontimicrobium sp. MEBiC01747]